MEEGTDLINRPFLDKKAAADLLTKHYDLKAADIEELISFTDQNFQVILDDPITIGGRNRRCSHFVLKLYNSRDSMDGNRIELSVNAMAYLSNKGFSCPLPVRNKHGKLLHLEKVVCDEEKQGIVGKHGLFMVVLLSFLPGELLSSLETIPEEVLQETGRQLAHMHKILETSLAGTCDEDFTLQRLVKDFEDYNHRKASTYCSGNWSLERVTGQRHLLELVKDTQVREDITKVIKLYEEHVEPVRHLFKKGIIHGDINDDNVIVSNHLASGQTSSKRYIVSGIIDFGEVAHSCIIFDIAIAVSEVVLVNQMSAGEQFLQGYLSQKDIADSEKKILYYLVLVRYAQRIMLSLEAIQGDPTNEYITKNIEDCIHLLHRLLHMQKREVDAIWNI